MPEPAKALILLTSRPESVEKLRPEILGVIFSQEVLEVVVAKCTELRAGCTGNVEFRYRLVDSPMEIGDAFWRFEHLLSELEGMGIRARRSCWTPPAGRPRCGWARLWRR